MKRALDFILSVSGLIVSSFCWLILALLIWLDDGGPTFYIQERLGLKGKPFKSIQFRSMIIGAEDDTGPIQTDVNDSRVTKIGSIMRATALDALPQLINIACGDMSFVGPRALRKEEKEVGSSIVKSVFEYPNFMDRCKVRPGLTGIAQILLPRDAPREVKFRYDIWYIKYQSIWLDIYLIFISILVTFSSKWEARDDKFVFLVKRLKDRMGEDL